MLDVLVVGAGLSGLAAADLLAERGHKVLVIEARSRVGGRTLSETIDGARFDLGGQWLGARQPRLSKLVSDLGIETFPQFHTGKKVLVRGGKKSTYDGAIPKLPLLSLVEMELSLRRLERERKKIPLDAPELAKNARALDRETVQGFADKTVHSADVKRLLATASRVVFGAELSEISLLWFLFYLQSGHGLLSLCEIEQGAQEVRFVHGAQTVSEKLAERATSKGAEIRLSHPVSAVQTDERGVQAHTSQGTLHAKLMIVAVPPALAGRIRFEPPLPAQRDLTFQKMPMGATVKALVTYDQPFWRQAGFSGEAVFDEGPVSVVFDATSHDGSRPALLAFLVGDAARRHATLPASTRENEVLAALAFCFGPRVFEKRKYIEKSWSEDPWTRGCPVGVVGPLGLSQFAGALRNPCGAIHWAGTETAEHWCGYLEGALEAGDRAAREVSGRLS